jgi:uncharacterized protein (DUF58 family)
MRRQIPARALAPLPAGELDRSRVKAIMEKVRQIDVRTARLVDNSLAGSYQSAFRASGIDFDQVREYVAGDEVRTIDWNVTARAGRPFVKQFREERELTLMIAVDVSASGDFGSATQSKRDLACELACVLATSAVRSNDLVGLVLFSDRIERFVPPRKGRGHALRIIREVLGSRPEGIGTDLALPLELLSAVLRHRCVVAVISDLEVPRDDASAFAALEQAARVLAARHDVIAIRPQDRRERELPDVGILDIEDAETGEVVRIDTARRRVRERFQQVSGERSAEVRRRLANTGVDVIELDTARPYIAAMHAFLTTRRRRTA